MDGTQASDLDLTEDSGFTIGSFVRDVFRHVPAPVSRARILDTLERLQKTYDTPDLARRLSLFSDVVVLEDPAGLLRATGRAELEAFFRSTLDNGVRILRTPVEVIVVGSEAIERYDMRLEKDGLEPQPLPHIVQYGFDDDARIRSVRVFFDLESIGL